MNKLFVAILVSAMLLVSGCVQQTAQQTPNQPSAIIPTTATIEMSESGFSPSEVTVQSGGTVTWINKGNTPIWPASANHPDHTVYPGSGFKKCGTAEQANIFDACKGIGPRQSWSFVFSEKGSWSYHNHLNPGQTGRVNVS